MASARTAMAAAPHMPKSFWFHAVLDASDKSNYLATEKEGQLQKCPLKHIQSVCSETIIHSPASFLPWGKVGQAVSAVKFKKKLEDRTEKACYLRKIGKDKYQVWIPATKKSQPSGSSTSLSKGNLIAQQRTHAMIETKVSWWTTQQPVTITMKNWRTA